MNTHDKNEEALYQQIMQELTPGAEEYDRILRERNKRKHVWLYAAAAGLLLVLAFTFSFMRREGSQPDEPLVAQTEPEKKALAKQEEKVETKQQQEAPADSSSKAEQPCQKKSKTRPYPKPHEDARPLMAENVETEVPIEAEEPPSMLTYDDLPVLNPNALDMTEEERALVERRMIEGQRRFLLEQYKALPAEAKIIQASFEEE